jgi:membrane fusion protein (multidrug efflux system)
MADDAGSPRVTRETALAAPPSAEAGRDEINAARNRRLRKQLFRGLGVGIAVTALGVGAFMLFFAGKSVSTEDAYVGVNIGNVTTSVSGTIVEIYARDTENVKAGQALVRIDSTDYLIELARARAAYGQSMRKVRQYFADAAGARAELASSRANLQRAKVDYDRRAALARSGAVSGEELTSARTALETARASVDAAARKLASEEAMVAGAGVNDNPEVLAAAAEVAKMKLAVERTTVKSPISGVVARNSLQVGQRVAAGQTLLWVAPLEEAYVDANFKEGQLRHMKVGQPAEVTSDLYGEGVVYRGRVSGIGAGSGSAFAIIPAQNATGNWIKVVQRVPVRIALDPKDLREHPLRAGLSMKVKVDLAEKPADQPVKQDIALRGSQNP